MKVLPSPYARLLARTPLTERTVVVDGVPAAVWEYGTPGKGPTFLFVHGFRGDHHGLQLLADCLPEFGVSSVELPGFGASDPFPDAEHTVAHHADALAAAVAALGLDAPPVLVAPPARCSSSTLTRAPV